MTSQTFQYLYFLEQYASTAYLGTYLDFLVVTQSLGISGQPVSWSLSWSVIQWGLHVKLSIYDIKIKPQH